MLKKTLLALLVLLVIGVLAHFVGTHFTGKVYEAALDRVRAAGEPLHHSELATSPIPDEDNVAAGLRDAHAWLEKHWETHPEPVTLWDDWTEHEEEGLEDAREYVRSIEPYLKMAEEALERPRTRLLIDWSRSAFEMEIDHIIQCQQLTNTLEYYAAWGEPINERIVRASRTCLELADRCPMPFVLGYLVNGVVRSRAARLLHQLHDRPGFSAVRLRSELDPLLAAATPDTGPPKRPLIEEQAAMLDLIDRILDGEQGELLSEWEGTRPWLYRRWFGRSFVQQDAAELLAFLRRSIDACETTPAEALAFADRIERDVDAAGERHSLQRMGGSILHKYFRLWVEQVAQLRLARVALAVMAHHELHGMWPDKLDPALPNDPYTGKPFVLERDEEHVVLRADPPEGLFRGPLEEAELLWRFEVDR